MNKDIVLDVAEVLQLEKDIESSGTSLYELMQRAGKALADLTISELKNRNKKGSVIVFCGNGNNGGDGWVAIEEMAKQEISMCVCSEVWSGDIKAMPAKLAVDSAYENASRYMSLYINPEKDDIMRAIIMSEIVIDAILGTGFKFDAVKEPQRTWIEAINEAKNQGAYVISCDVPSGMNAQTGEVADVCVKADKTVTMMCNKTGMTLPKAREYTGDIVVAEIAEIDKFLQ